MRLQCTWSIFVTERQTRCEGVSASVCMLVCEALLLIHRQCDAGSLLQLCLAGFTGLAEAATLQRVTGSCVCVSDRLLLCVCVFLCVSVFASRRDRQCGFLCACRHPCKHIEP